MRLPRKSRSQRKKAAARAGTRSAPGTFDEIHEKTLWVKWRPKKVQTGRRRCSSIQSPLGVRYRGGDVEEQNRDNCSL